MEKNNFNFLRLLFALSVIVTHSYPLSGEFTGDWLSRFTHAQAEFSFMGLSGFFIISGYLIYRSLDRSKTLVEYFLKRALRIYPGLFCVLLLSVIGGALVSTGTITDYLSNSSAWTYLPKNMSIIKQQMKIDGVFTNNPYDATINGSLWSLLYEVVFYVILAALFFCNRRVSVFTLGAFTTLLVVCNLFYKQEVSALKFPIVEVRLFIEFGPFFFFGSLLGAVNLDALKHRNLAVLVLGVGLILVFYFNCFPYLKFFILTPLVLLIGLGTIKPFVWLINKFGDASYGIYIYGFPIQQALMNYFKFTSIELMTVSLPLTIIMGYASWHLVEKRFLRLKKGWLPVSTKQ